MTHLERFIALRRLRCFDTMNDDALVTLTEKTMERQWAPGETICEPGALLEMVYFVIRGNVFFENDAGVSEILGAPSLLFGLPVKKRLHACPENGAVTLMLSKAHFFTTIRQFPAMLLYLAKMTPEPVETDADERRSD